MNRTMISFLTNEQTPKKLQEALKSLKQNKGKATEAKKDRLLVVLGVSFLTGIFVLFVLLVLSMLILY
ncbi:hypothetical protein U0035_13085 [Niabella yanshanensis]|uniref:Uncharacterized protein n=1 Tax=Niabella yanshanensis TaxID=577386 RepID=A0ABZ0W0I8_9BACT|nr:hypothetical protein [Niabella yanshanensis]WQD36601.1 hypothetical protein U0035_13085 [Niabella yanshanensis]